MSNFIVGYTRGSNIRGIIELEGKDIDTLKGKWCIYENETGVDLAKIVCVKSDDSCRKFEKKNLGNLVRPVNNEDIERIKRIRQFEAESEKTCRDLIDEHHLPMKIIRTTLSFDEKRLTFYFIADERVDFRKLVKDLVSRFHKMIRLQQIGPRDHARIINGVGICGRELCCANFLSEVSKITKDAASRQGMEGVGSDKISGVCGKLLCCLRYELDDYGKNKSKE